jgi:hypothetical protein
MNLIKKAGVLAVVACMSFSVLAGNKAAIDAFEVKPNRLLKMQKP